MTFGKEIWKPVITEQEDYTGLYEVSNYGRVKSLKREWYSGVDYKGLRMAGEKIKSQSVNGSGYFCVGLTKNNILRIVEVHILVANAFLGYPAKNIERDHIDGNRQNNNVDNLQLISHRENCAKGWQIKRGKKYPIGVSKISKRFRALIYIDGKTKYLGTFDCPLQAYLEYDKESRLVA